MKKKILLAIATIFISFATVHAQTGSYQHQTVQEKVANTMSKLADLKLDAATTTKADSIFTDFYTAQQKAMQDMMAAGGQPDRDAMRQKRQQLADERDAKLKAIFTDDQYNKWKNDIEPALRPQRGGNRPS